MKLDSAVLLTKGTCFFLAAVCLQLAQALAQWSNSGEWPSRLQWIIVIAGCVAAGANALLSFLSGSYADFVKGRVNGKSTGNTGSDTALIGKPATSDTPDKVWPKP